MLISNINIVNTTKNGMYDKQTSGQPTDTTTVPPRKTRGTETDNGVPEYLQCSLALINTLIKADILPELNT